MSKVNSSNQNTSDPREQLCWDLYIEKLSNGIINAYQSAVEAGYSISHAENITLQGWFKERLAKLRRKDMLSKAEKVLDETLDYIALNEEGKIDVGIARIKLDAAKVVATTLGKDEGYSTRSELTGKDGESLNINIVSYVDDNDSIPV